MLLKNNLSNKSLLNTIDLFYFVKISENYIVLINWLEDIVIVIIRARIHRSCVSTGEARVEM